MTPIPTAVCAKVSVLLRQPPDVSIALNHQAFHMSRIFVRRLLQLTAAVCASGMLLLLFPLVLGSAEEFPTDEQEAKVRIAAVFLLLLFAAVGGISLSVLRRMKRMKRMKRIKP